MLAIPYPAATAKSFLYRAGGRGGNWSATTPSPGNLFRTFPAFPPWASTFPLTAIGSPTTMPPTAPCGVARSTAHKNFNSFFHRCLPTYHAGLPTARSSPSLDILRASYGKSTWCLRREVLLNCSIEVPPIWPIPVGHLMANHWHLAKIPSTTRAHRFTSSISRQKTPPSSRALTASTRLAGHPTDGISPPSR